ncbi:hypothetical protein RhiirA1_415798 [Rhizophagus irregularis]|uniref:Ede1p n=1 Tax=Rhizophagus irregularis TaxID=588596 RepID=A0A2N0S1A0_9GLOM|nr:hypothetical protein RhiirA1_415798 [Rhizophagus irregularis]CAB4483010.1 unnamed protein product [Rhizophagus irregularis]CAB5393335.1 unnamed protein product [Rhizophagus irregularis]
MDLSRSPSLIKTKGPEITLSSEEKRVYSQLFQVADEENKGVISGQNAVKLFVKSHLPSSVLSNIWQIADNENKGFLTQQTFSVALKLIAQVQSGKSPDPSNLNAEVPVPRFEGIDIEPYEKPGQIITDEDREKYKDMFYKLNPINGILEGGKAKEFFMRSKLNVEKLGQIWTLADTKVRGKLDLPEFIIAMHLIQQTMKGSIKTLPSELPNGFYEMASGTEINTPASPPIFARNLSSPRPGQSPVTRHMTLDSGTITPSIFQDNSWDVTEREKASFDRLFDEENKNGYITGEGAANFFMKSKLHHDQLAQIWDLADINKSGRLSRDEFAVAMHLITKKMAGVPLPTRLPDSLIPPSMRPVTASPFNDLKRSTTMSNKPSRPHTSQPSESDLFFESLQSLQHTAAASPSPFFSSTASQSGNEFDLLGDTDISTKIALESGEIKNYKLQSENLNKAITDLKTNRENVDSNISSLVTQKQDMMTQLSQIRTLYESEAKAMREVQAKYELEHESVERARQELLQAENAFKALQSERDQLQANIQKDRDETLDIKRRMRIIEEETVSIKIEIEKYKKDEKQQKGILDINRKQLSAVEGEKEKAFKTLQGFEDKNLSSDEINDPFGNGAFTPLAFNPSNTTQGPGISTSQPIVDFNDFQKPSNHSHHGSLSSISGSRVKRSMSNTSTASNSTLGTSSIKSAPLNNNKSDELSFDKPITVASSKPSEFENFLSDQILNTPQEVTANAENNKVNPFDSTFNDPFGVVSNDQTNKSIQNTEESTAKQDIFKESEKSEADPFANINNVPTPGKPVSNNDDLNSDSFTKEFPSIEELEASMTNASNSGFDNNFNSLITNNEKKDDNLMNVNNLMETIQNEKSDNTFSIGTTAEAVSVNNMEINTDNKDTNNTSNKESESPFSILADSTESAETAFPPLQDPDAWVSIESSKSFAPQDEFDAAFGDLTEAKVTKTPPIEFDTGFDDADFEEDVNFTFDTPTTLTKSSSTSNNNTLTSFKTNNFAKSSLDFDKDENLFDDFDPFPPNAPSSNKPKANLDAAFGGISAEPSKTNFDDFGFDDAFSEFMPADKKSTTNTSIKASTSSQPKLQPTTPANSIEDDDIDDVKRLLVMGYSRDRVVKALEQNNYDFEKSLNFLVENS